MPRSKRFSPRVLLALAVLVSLAVSLFFPLHNTRDADFGAHFSDTVSLPQEPTQVKEDLSGSIHGLVVEESGELIKGIHVKLIPANKPETERWDAALSEWTNADGEYRFQHVEPGVYIVSVAREDAPSAQHPFLGVYLPGVEDESEAERVKVEPAARIGLRLVRLKRVETVKLAINVEFADGTRPRWSTLLFHNPSFPHQGVIGDEASGVSNGKGEFAAPVDFEYLARATAWCDAGDHIDMRESRPIQRIRVTSYDAPKELTFVIPGPACPLWTPKP